MASCKLVAFVAVVAVLTTHPDVAVGVNAVQVVAVHVYVTVPTTVVLVGWPVMVSVPTPVAVKVTPLITTVVPAADVLFAKVPRPVAATALKPARLVLYTT